MEAFKRIYPEDYYLKFLEHKLRPDGRVLNATRKTVITTGSISSADGSSFVKLGSTAVICGIKAEVGPPNPTCSNIRKRLKIFFELPSC